MDLKIYFAVFIAFCSVVRSEQNCGARDESVGKTTAKANINSWPWLVAFKYWPDDKLQCSGTLISEKHVLTGE